MLRGEKSKMKIMSLLQRVESEQKISITGKQRFYYIEKYLSHCGERFSTIYDIGGTNGTRKLFAELYPDAEVRVFNMDEDELGYMAEGSYLNIEKDPIPGKCDLLFAGEIIEHLIEPYDAVKKMCDALNCGGTLIFTTPNIANIYNRIFLLFGFALGNYHPSMRYRLGNPFLDKGDGVYSGSHKSLFNFRGLNEMMRLLDMEVVKTYGFSYYDFNANINRCGNSFRIQYPVVRKVANDFFCKGLREGMIFICKKR